ncbi:MAG: PKD domain-containing protein, partial [Planctomycetota bacterium]
WDFGDGNTSVQQNPTHVFEETGEYTVRLQVSGPGGMSALVHEEMVIVISPQNHMWIGDVRAFPGQRTVNVPVLGTHDREAQGYQIAATFDPSIATVAHVDFLETNVGTLTAELQAFEISNDPDEPYVTAGLLFDIEPPFDRRKLPAGRAQRLANIVVDINSSARGGTSSPIRLEHGVGRPPINNLFVIDTSSVLPELPDRGTIYIEAVTFPPPRFFVRGDVDDNQRVTISDAITILNYLFVGGEMPACLDAADTNDSGSVDLTDAAYALNFLFKAGSYLPEPHPRAGLDPTPDNLPLCRFQ